MNDPEIPQYRALLTVDIEDYSSRTDAEQRVLQSALMTALDRAADAAEMSREQWEKQLGGDGLMALLPQGCDVRHLLDVLIRRFDAELGLYNRLREQPTWSRIRIRLAVHAGPIHVEGPSGWPGQHAVLPARLRDSDPVRVALAARPAADLAVIVSAQVYDDYVTQGPGNPRPSEFRAVHVKAKKHEYTGYLYLPGLDVNDVTELIRYDVAEPQRPEGASPTSLEPCAPESASGISAGRDVFKEVSNQVSGGGSVTMGGGR